MAKKNTAHLIENAACEICGFDSCDDLEYWGTGADKIKFDRTVACLTRLIAPKDKMIKRIKMQLASAQEDSERLDWLCRPWESQSHGEQTVSYTFKQIDGSFRSAIDAARKIS